MRPFSGKALLVIVLALVVAAVAANAMNSDPSDSSTPADSSVVANQPGNPAAQAPSAQLTTPEAPVDQPGAEDEEELPPDPVGGAMDMFIDAGERQNSGSQFWIEPVISATGATKEFVYNVQILVNFSPGIEVVSAPSSATPSDGGYVIKYAKLGQEEQAGKFMLKMAPNASNEVIQASASAPGVNTVTTELPVGWIGLNEATGILLPNGNNIPLSQATPEQVAAANKTAVQTGTLVAPPPSTGSSPATQPGTPVAPTPAASGGGTPAAPAPSTGSSPTAQPGTPVAPAPTS